MTIAVRAEPLIYSITAPDFSSGIIVHRGIVIGGQDRLKFMSGWNLWQVLKYCNHRGWIWEQVRR